MSRQAPHSFRVSRPAAFSFSLPHDPHSISPSVFPCQSCCMFYPNGLWLYVLCMSTYVNAPCKCNITISESDANVCEGPSTGAMPPNAPPTYDLRSGTKFAGLLGSQSHCIHSFQARAVVVWGKGRHVILSRPLIGLSQISLASSNTSDHLPPTISEASQSPVPTQIHYSMASILRRTAAKSLTIGMIPADGIGREVLPVSSSACLIQRHVN